MKKNIIQQCKPNAEGIAFLIGFSDGADIQDLSSTFENDLSFAVWSIREITCTEIACLVKAAVKVQYPPTYKYIVFYYAGDVGVNKSKRTFLVPVQPKGIMKQRYWILKRIFFLHSIQKEIVHLVCSFLIVV